MARPQPSSTRAAKVAGLQKQARAAERRRQLLIWGTLALVVLLIVGGVGYAIASRPTLDAVASQQDLSREHVSEVPTYEQNPPMGGDHNAAWWDCGIYDEPIPPYHAVHSLEHGAVWLTYQPDLAEDQVEMLRDLAGQEFMLMSPDEGQDAPVIATAWGVQLEADTADDPRLPRFIREYRQGPQTPEPGATCTGGTTVDLLPGE